MLILLGVSRTFVGLELEFAKVGDATHGRLRGRGDLDQVQAGFFRTADGLFNWQNANLLTINGFAELLTANGSIIISDNVKQTSIAGFGKLTDAKGFDIHNETALTGILSTGTPPGVGMGQKPSPVYLKDGDVMRLGIAGLGEQTQAVHAWNPELIDS